MHWLLRGVLDIFYPPRCQICRRFTPAPLCPHCLGQITLIQPPVCHHCGVPLDPLAKGPDKCLECLHSLSSPITWARSAGLYEGPLRQAILAFKFLGRRALTVPLADLLVGLLKNGLHGVHAAFDLACPVPLHPQRQKERGFNQSELIARYFCQQTGIRLETGLLQRTRPTIPQVMLPPGQRARNVRGAFSLSPQASAKGARILLIDDLYTTGSTLKECARVLRKGAAAEVYVITLARPRPSWMPPRPPAA